MSPECGSSDCRCAKGLRHAIEVGSRALEDMQNCMQKVENPEITASFGQHLQYEKFRESEQKIPVTFNKTDSSELDHKEKYILC